MQARCFCPTHGKLGFEDIVIKNGLPICAKCQSVLEFGKVVPRKVEKAEKSARGKRRQKKKR